MIGTYNKRGEVISGLSSRQQAEVEWYQFAHIFKQPEYRVVSVGTARMGDAYVYTNRDAVVIYLRSNYKQTMGWYLGAYDTDDDIATGT